MKNKLLLVLSLAVVMSMILAACGGGAPEPTEVVTEEPAPVTEPPVVEPAGTLRIWADDTRTPILQALADDFLATYNVELVVEDLGVVQDIRSQAIIAIPAIKVIMLDQRKALSSWARSNSTKVSMGTAMLIASVSRKMPLMKVMVRKVGQAIYVGSIFSRPAV
jgi:ABC-type glycerol-3-phosphate transport system substrate-binding protein